MDGYDNDHLDDETPEPGASVFGDDASFGSESSVFDAPGDSVLGEQQSVFGQEEPEWGADSEQDAADPHSDEPPVDADATQLDADPWAARETVSVDDWGQVGGDTTIALDVEPEESDDLDAWSGLATEEPQWGETAPQADWDPGPAPEPSEPEVVRIGDPSEQFFTYDDQVAYADEGFIDSPPSGDRDMQSAWITGLAMLAIAVVALSIGPIVALGLIVVVVALSAGEFFNAVRVAGYQPATLLGLTASVAMPLAVYWRGLQAVPLIIALSVVFGLLWFLSGITIELPVMNLGVTLLGILYVGLLGSFGAAMLEITDRAGVPDEGVGLLLAAIVVTIGYDVGAFFAGRSIGRTPLTSVSPNKTVEGLVGGAFVSFIAAIVFFGIVKFVDPWDIRGELTDAILLGVLGAIVAPLGDLSESLIKRDLGIKDMGSVLPGHGGFLDRFDALLFVLPAVYFLAEAVFY
ncbi:MAG: phosphatidate cytidylyltransferase [Acidimicrobiales bacterium]